jgi:dTDP-4-amino-4,6-dideoxygalactose transaminase
MTAILEIARKYELSVIQDACQAHGAQVGGAPIGSLGTAACYSFYPSKNLGAFGDGGMVLTNSRTLAERIRMLRNLGQRSKNQYEMLGLNSRLDTLQAAILRVKLRYLERDNQRRRRAATRYRELLSAADVTLPVESPDVTHVYHLFVVQHSRRDDLAMHLHNAGLQCGIHYPEPIHGINLFSSVRTVPEGAPISAQLAKRILSLPMFPDLTDEQIERVAHAVRAFNGQLAVA